MIPTKEEDRRQLFYIANGRELSEDDHWFRPLTTMIDAPLSATHVEGESLSCYSC